MSTATPEGEKKFPGWLMLLGALIAVAPLSIDMYLPAFPAMALALEADRGAIERTLPVFLLGLSIGQLLYGPLSDRLGRRGPLLVGLLIYGVGSAGCALAKNADALTLWRLVQALGGGAGLVIARAVIRDRLDVRQSARAISTVMLIMGVAPILAPMLGSAMLLVTGWQAIFVVQMIFGLVCMLWALFTMPETRPNHLVTSLRPSKVIQTYWQVVMDARFIFPALCAGFAMGGMFAYIAGSPFVLITLYGLGEQAYALVFGANAFGLIAASQFNGYLLRRYQPEQLLKVTVAMPLVFALILFCVSLFDHAALPFLLVGLFGYASCLGAISPNTSALSMATQGGRAGAASALLGSLTYTAGMVAGLAVSLLEGHSALPLASVMLVCGALSLLCGLATLRYSVKTELPPVVPIEPLP